MVSVELSRRKLIRLRRPNDDWEVAYFGGGRFRPNPRQRPWKKLVQLNKEQPTSQSAFSAQT